MREDHRECRFLFYAVMEMTSDPEDDVLVTVSCLTVAVVARPPQEVRMTIVVGGLNNTPKATLA